MSTGFTVTIESAGGRICDPRHRRTAGQPASGRPRGAGGGAGAADRRPVGGRSVRDQDHPRTRSAGTRGRHRSRHRRGTGRRGRRGAGAPAPADAVPADDPEFFARLLPVALGSERRRRARATAAGAGRLSAVATRPCRARRRSPTTVNVAIIGAGIAGINVALACRRGRRRPTKSSTATTRSAAPG